MKKLFAALLALVMVLSAVSAAAWAEGWFEEPVVDEFGDPVGSSVWVTAEAEGTYTDVGVDGGALRAKLNVSGNGIAIKLYPDGNTILDNITEEDIPYTVSVKDAAGNVSAYVGVMASQTNTIQLSGDDVLPLMVSLYGEETVKFSIVRDENKLTRYTFALGQDNGTGIAGLLNAWYDAADTFADAGDMEHADAIFTRLGSYRNAFEQVGRNRMQVVAATVGTHDITTAELTYYFIDEVNSFRTNYGSYAMYFGLDTSKPLDQQMFNAAAGQTWADQFLTEAIQSAQMVNALCDAAEAEGFTLSEEQMESVTNLSDRIDSLAAAYSLSSGDEYLKRIFGSGAEKESYLRYYIQRQTAGAYQTYHQDSLTYTPEQIEARYAADPAAYDTFSYRTYQLPVSKFLAGGTTDESGNTTYSDEEQAAAQQSAEAAANSLLAVSAEELDAAIAALPVNEGTSASAKVFTAQRVSSVSELVKEWVIDQTRTAGDKAVIPAYDADGETVIGYCVAFFDGRGDNSEHLVDVRHILFTADSEEAKDDARASAEEILNIWAEGGSTEDGFAALAGEYTMDPGSQQTGGLYQNIYPGQMVAAFNEWCFDPARVPGDTGIVETEYGFHVMYFSAASSQTYRESLIVADLRQEDMNQWHTALADANPITAGNTQYINRNVVMG